MTAAAKDLNYKYHNLDVVGGSSAYELDWEERERELRHAGEGQRYQEETRRQERAKVHTAARVQVREAQHVSMVAILGVSAVLCLALMVLASYINLTAISAETVSVQNQLETLETQNVALTAEYQQMFDMTTVKDVAQAAGMGKPGASQVTYIDLTGGDSAVVYRAEEPSVLTRILTSLHHGVCTVLEYFE